MVCRRIRAFNHIVIGISCYKTCVLSLGKDSDILSSALMYNTHALGTTMHMV